jgi:hypothetical protein
VPEYIKEVLFFFLLKKHPILLIFFTRPHMLPSHAILYPATRKLEVLPFFFVFALIIPWLSPLSFLFLSFFFLQVYLENVTRSKPFGRSTLRASGCSNLFVRFLTKVPTDVLRSHPLKTLLFTETRVNKADALPFGLYFVGFHFERSNHISEEQSLLSLEPPGPAPRIRDFGDAKEWQKFFSFQVQEAIMRFFSYSASLLECYARCMGELVICA